MIHFYYFMWTVVSIARLWFKAYTWLSTFHIATRKKNNNQSNILLYCMKYIRIEEKKQKQLTNQQQSRMIEQERNMRREWKKNENKFVCAYENSYNIVACHIYKTKQIEPERETTTSFRLVNHANFKTIFFFSRFSYKHTHTHIDIERQQHSRRMKTHQQKNWR